MRCALLLCVSLAACQPASIDPDATLATLERRDVWGGARWYRVTISNAGKLTWEGNADHLPLTAKLSAAELEQVRAAFHQAGYFELTGDFACRGLTDLPVLTSSYSDGARRRTVEHHLGCRQVPGIEALNTLEGRLVEIAGAPRDLGGY